MDKSNLVVKQVTSKGQLVEGVECYMRYMDLKKKEGAVTAKLIRDEKRVLQEQAREESRSRCVAIHNGPS